MRALKELGTVIVAGIVAFFTGLLMIGAVLILWSLGLVSALMLMVSAFGGVMYLITGKAHEAHIAVVYLGYAAVPFVASFVFHVYRGMWADSRQRIRSCRALTAHRRRMTPDRAARQKGRNGLVKAGNATPAAAPRRWAGKSTPSLVCLRIRGRPGYCSSNPSVKRVIADPDELVTASTPRHLPHQP